LVSIAQHMQQINGGSHPLGRTNHQMAQSLAPRLGTRVGKAQGIQIPGFFKNLGILAGKTQHS
jgi:hypothetical protein